MSSSVDLMTDVSGISHKKDVALKNGKIKEIQSYKEYNDNKFI